MPGTNQFLAFATGNGSNVLAPAEYASLSSLSQGFQAGIAKSKEVNTPLRQATFVAAAIAQLIANNNQNALDDGDLSGFVAKLSSAIVSTGNTPGLVAYFAQTTAPSGWIKANGAAVSRTVYANLFSVIGTQYGVGDGSSTFNLPDLRGEFLRGYDDGRGADSGRVFGSAQGDNFKSHTHVQAHTGIGDGSLNQMPIGGGSLPWTQSILTTAATGGNETRPRNIAMMACIKY